VERRAAEILDGTDRVFSLEIGGKVSLPTPSISANNVRDDSGLDIARLIPDGGVAVELGVARGQFSKKLLEGSKTRVLYSIDAWAGGKVHNAAEYNAVIRLLKPYGQRSVVIRTTTSLANKARISATGSSQHDNTARNFFSFFKAMSIQSNAITAKSPGIKHSLLPCFQGIPNSRISSGTHASPNKTTFIIPYLITIPWNHFTILSHHACACESNPRHACLIFFWTQLVSFGLFTGLNDNAAQGA
jgi:hypothetical protein